MSRKRKKYESRKNSPGECGRPPRLQVAAVCGLLLLAVIAVYGQTARHHFVSWDDDEYVYENPHVLGGLTGENFVWALTQRVSRQWHPLTMLSLMADTQIYLRPGGGPPDLARLAAGMHRTNVALHAVNVVLLFLVLRAMTGRLWPSACVAAVFAVHPLHVESVAWITERKDVLSGLFGLFALAAYAWYARGPSPVRYLSVAAALALGLMAKAMLVTWPFLFLLLDYWPLGRWTADGGQLTGTDKESRPSPTTGHRSRSTTIAWLLLEKAPLLLLVAVFAVVSFVGQQSGHLVTSLEAVPLSERIARTAVVYVAYLGKTLWPSNLAALYPDADGELRAGHGGGSLAGPAHRRSLVGGAARAAVAGSGLVLVSGHARARDRPGPSRFRLLCRPFPVPAANRRLHCRCLGRCACGGAMALWALLFGAVSAVMAAALIVSAWRQVQYWRDGETMWSHALDCTSQNRIAHYNLADLLVQRKQFDAAIVHYQEAIKIKADYLDARNNLANALAACKRWDEAILQYQEILKIEPGSADTRYNFGMVRAQPGRFEESIVQYQEAIKIQPDLALAHYRLGLALAELGRLDEAHDRLQKALSLASAQNQGALANDIRARIRRLPPVGRASRTP